MDSGEWAAGEAGCRGTSPVLRVPYVRHSVWLQPPGHLMLHGLVKSFWKVLLAPKKQNQPAYPWALDDKTKQLMRSRAAHLKRGIADCGRSYR